MNKKLLVLLGSLLSLLSYSGICTAQDPSDNRGLLGVWVSPADDGGMVIERFIRDTPASKLNRDGQIHRGDVIVKLAGSKVSSVNTLRRARGKIPFGKEGKMVLRDRRHNYYHVWIGRKDPATACEPEELETLSQEQIEVKCSDGFSYGGEGDGGDEPDIRDPESHRAVEGLEVAAPEEYEDDESVRIYEDESSEDIESADNPDIR